MVLVLPSGRWQARYKGPDGIDRPAPRTFALQGQTPSAGSSLTDAEIIQGGWLDPDARASVRSRHVRRRAWIEPSGRGCRPKTAQSRTEDLLRRHLGPAS